MKFFRENKPGPSNQINDFAKIIWDFNIQKDPIKESDCILVLGSNDIRVAQRGAQLFRQGFAPLMVFSGNTGRLTEGLWDEPEANVFAAEAKKMGVPEENITIENKSTNTGENLEFTKQILRERELNPRSFILVQKPYMQWRAWATFKKVFPDTAVVVTAPDISFEEYPNDVLSREHIINVMVGDLQRLKLYSEKGFSVPVDIPKHVWQAYEKLVDLGYTEHLITEN